MLDAQVNAFIVVVDLFREREREKREDFFDIGYKNSDMLPYQQQNGKTSIHAISTPSKTLFSTRTYVRKHILPK